MIFRRLTPSSPTTVKRMKALALLILGLLAFTGAGLEGSAEAGNRHHVAGKKARKHKKSRKKKGHKRHAKARRHRKNEYSSTDRVATPMAAPTSDTGPAAVPVAPPGPGGQ